MAKRLKQNLSDSQIKKNKTDKIMNIVAERASYYRANPHRFVKDYLGIELKLFQKNLQFEIFRANKKQEEPWLKFLQIRSRSWRSIPI